MKSVLAGLFTALAMSSALALDAFEVEGVIDGQRIEFDADIRAQVVDRSVELLSSCHFKDLNPQRTIADAEKQSHVRMTFAPPRRIEARAVDSVIDVREMLITFAPGPAAIWARTDHDDVIYFAKWLPAPAQSLRTLLQEERSRQSRSR
jgi:hypothetical protein